MCWNKTKILEWKEKKNLCVHFSFTRCWAPFLRYTKVSINYYFQIPRQALPRALGADPHHAGMKGNSLLTLSCLFLAPRKSKAGGQMRSCLAVMAALHGEVSLEERRGRRGGRKRGEGGEGERGEKPSLTNRPCSKAKRIYEEEDC